MPLHHGTRSERLEDDCGMRYSIPIGAMPRGLRLACKPTYKGSEKSGPLVLALPGLAWVQIESAAVEVDGCFEVLGIAEAAGHALDLLDLAVEPLAHRVGHRMLVVGHDVVDVPANRLGRLANRLQPAVRRPEVPPFPELPA